MSIINRMTTTMFRGWAEFHIILSLIVIKLHISAGYQFCINKCIIRTKNSIKSLLRRSLAFALKERFICKPMSVSVASCRLRRAGIRHYVWKYPQWKPRNMLAPISRRKQQLQLLNIVKYYVSCKHYLILNYM